MPPTAVNPTIARPARAWHHPTREIETRPMRATRDNLETILTEVGETDGEVYEWWKTIAGVGKDTGYEIASSSNLPLVLNGSKLPVGPDGRYLHQYDVDRCRTSVLYWLDLGNDVFLTKVPTDDRSNPAGTISGHYDRLAAADPDLVVASDRSLAESVTFASRRAIAEREAESIDSAIRSDHAAAAFLADRRWAESGGLECLECGATYPPDKAHLVDAGGMGCHRCNGGR